MAKSVVLKGERGHRPPLLPIPFRLDLQVSFFWSRSMNPRNKTESEVKASSQRQQVQMAVFKKKVQMMIREQVDKQHSISMKRAFKKEVKVEKEAVRVKRARQDFKTETIRLSKSVVTARDVVSLIPVDEGGFTIIFDQEKKIFQLKKKESTPKPVETVAKPREKSFGHTFILAEHSEELPSLEDVEALWNEQSVMQQ